MTINGIKIRLRPFNSDDIGIIYTWRQDPKLRMLAQFHLFPVTQNNEQQWLESVISSKSNKNIYFAIEAIDENKIIGYFQLKNIDWISRVAWLGIIIGDKNSRGKGYGKEAMELGLNYAFKYLNLRKITLEVLDNNVPAIALYEKLGFTKEGVLKKHYYYDDKYIDSIIMSITK